MDGIVEAVVECWDGSNGSDIWIHFDADKKELCTLLEHLRHWGKFFMHEQLLNTHVAHVVEQLLIQLKKSNFLSLFFALTKN